MPFPSYTHTHTTHAHTQHAHAHTHTHMHTHSDAEARPCWCAHGGDGPDVGGVCGRLHREGHWRVCHATEWNSEQTHNHTLATWEKGRILFVYVFVVCVSGRACASQATQALPFHWRVYTWHVWFCHSCPPPSPFPLPCPSQGVSVEAVDSVFQAKKVGHVETNRTVSEPHKAACVFVCVCMCACVRACVCVCVCVFVYACVHVYVTDWILGRAHSEVL